MLLPSQQAEYDRQGFLILRGQLTSCALDELRIIVAPLLEPAHGGHRPAHTPLLLSLAQQAGGGVAACLISWLHTYIVPTVADLLMERSMRYSMLSILNGGDPTQQYRQHWHKDCHWWFHGITQGSANEAAVGKLCHRRHVQFSVPINAQDSFLQVIPSSYSRTSTAKECSASFNFLQQRDVAQETCSMEVNTGTLPDATTIQLDPGDIGVWDMNLLHRGWNPTGSQRCTIFGSYFTADTPVLQHEAGQTHSVKDAIETLRKRHISSDSIEPLDKFLKAHPTDGGELGTLLNLLRKHRMVTMQAKGKL